MLDLFTPQDFDWGVTEVAKALGISKSGAHAQLSALAEIGLLTRTIDNRYQLGWRLVALSQTLLRGTGMTGDRRVLEALVDRAGPGCGADLMVRDGLDVFSIGRAVHQSARVPWIDFGRLLSTTTAFGKLLLATRPMTRAEQALMRVGGSSDSEGSLAEEFESIRRNGAAWDCGETFPGVTGVAGPVRDSTGAVIAAVSLYGPSDRFLNEYRTWERLIGEAAKILLPRRMSSSNRVLGAEVSAPGQGVDDFQQDLVGPRAA